MPGPFAGLHQPDGVGGVRRARHEHQVRSGGDRPHGGLPVGGRVADVVAARRADRREALPQRAGHLGRLVDRQRGLHQVGDPLAVARPQRGDVRGRLDQHRGPGRLAQRALDLLVAGVADQRHRVAVGGEPPGLGVHLGHQRAGRVDHGQPPAARLRADRRRHAVRGEHHGRAVGHLVQLVDEHRAAAFQVADHAGVVHDLLAHVDRRPLQLQGALDDLDGPVHAGAERPRPGQQHLARAARRRPPLRHRRGGPQRAQRGQPAGDDAGQRAVRGVGHGPDHRHRAPGRAGGQRPGLHVGQRPALGGQLGPLGAPHQVVDGGDPAGAHGQSRAAQLAGQDRRGRAGHGACFGADDQVARAQVGAQAAAHAHDHHGAERAVAQLLGLARRARGAVAGPPDGGRVGAVQAAADGPGLDAQRRADEQRIRLRRVRRAGLAVARPGDGLRHALPPEVWAVTYRPSALRGKARRYR